MNIYSFAIFLKFIFGYKNKEKNYNCHICYITELFDVYRILFLLCAEQSFMAWALEQME